MKSKILLVAIAFLVLFFSLNGNAQTIDRIPQLKNAESNNETISAADKGELIEVSVYSPGLEGNFPDDSPYRKTMVYLPPGYYSNPAKHYPVVYLFGGWGAKHDFWFGGETPDYDLRDTLDNLFIQCEFNPFILVSPDNYNKYAGSWVTNSALAGNWEDFNAFDLVSYIDNNFRTIPQAKSRGIAGWSMGGHGAVKLALKYPNIFSSLYSISGALIDFNERIINDEITKNEFINTAKLSSFSEDYLNSFSAAIAFAPNENVLGYGELPFNKDGVLIDSIWQKWLKHDPVSLIPDYILKEQQLTAITLECGTLEPPIYKENLTFSDLLTKNGVDHTLNVHGGDHIYSVNKRMGSYVFPFFSKNLQQSAIELKWDKCLNNSDSLTAQLYIDGALYIVPFETENNENAIQTEQLKSVETLSFSEAKISLSNIDDGIYKVVGISTEGYVSSPVAFSVVSETPKIKFRVSDLSSGKALENCNVKVNEEPFNTNENGELNLEGCGKHSVNFSFENYYTEDTTFTFFTDTTIVMTLVHDSYIKVIDRVSQVPLPNITLTIHGISAKTDRNGFGIVQNLRNGLFSYSIPQSTRYFSESATINLNPGDTAIIALTNKRATIQFLIQDEMGVIANQKMIMDGKEYISDEEGIIKIRSVDAREIHTYSIENPEYVSILDSVYIGMDTLVNVMLTKITLNNDMETSDFIIFPNPVNKVLTIQTGSIQNASIEILSLSGKLIFSCKITETEHHINLAPYKSGVYFIRFTSHDFTSTRKIIKL